MQKDGVKKVGPDGCDHQKTENLSQHLFDFGN